MDVSVAEEHEFHVLTISAVDGFVPEKKERSQVSGLLDVTCLHLCPM